MRLPAEWEPQDGVMLAWPDENTPWYALESVQDCYARIISAILRRERVLLAAREPGAALERLRETAAAQGLSLQESRLHIVQCPLNDTWSRDHGGIAVSGPEGEKYIYDFVFNGWGLKFASDLDNQVTRTVFFNSDAYAPDAACVDMRPFVLEGGSIDTDGAGTLMTTSSCLLSANRNDYLEKEEIEGELKSAFGLERVLWLDSGTIQGDDTDSHVDILARFCSPETIAYVSCDDPENPDYESLQAMEDQLRRFRTPSGGRYRLIPLPMAETLYLEGERLPASYANFLIINGAVLMPGTGSPLDGVAAGALQKAFPDREVEVINCYPLLSGHGGLHCVTMQYPKGWLNIQTL